MHACSFLFLGFYIYEIIKIKSSFSYYCSNYKKKIKCRNLTAETSAKLLSVWHTKGEIHSIPIKQEANSSSEFGLDVVAKAKISAPAGVET
jgi:hypothetical protein